MNRDQAKGRMRTAKGHAKEAAGKAMNDERLRSEGQGEQAAGQVQSGYGDVKRDVKRTAKKISDR